MRFAPRFALFATLTIGFAAVGAAVGLGAVAVADGTGAALGHETNMGCGSPFAPGHSTDCNGGNGAGGSGGDDPDPQDGVPTPSDNLPTEDCYATGTCY